MVELTYKYVELYLLKMEHIDFLAVNIRYLGCFDI